MKEIVLNKDRVKNYVSIWIIGFLTHLYIFTNKFYNEDDINNLTTKAEQASLGRWLDDMLNWVLPTYSIPMINGPLAVAILVLTAIIVCKIFKIHKVRLEFLVGCIFVTFPVFASNFTWMIAAHRYALAILLAVLFDYFLLCKNFRGHTAVAIGCLVAALGIYQIYLCLAMGILWLWIIKYTFEMYLKDGMTLSNVLKKIIGLFLCAVIAAAIYGVITKIMLSVWQTSLASYQNINKVFNINILDYLVGMLKAYYRAIMFQIGGMYGKISIYLVVVHVLILILSGYVIWKNWRIKVKKGNGAWKIILLCEVALLPAFIESIEIMAATAQSRHMIMRFGSILWYVIPVVVLDRIWDEEHFSFPKIKTYLSTLMLVVICINVYTCNLAYFKCSLTTKNLEALLNRVAYAVEQTDGYVPNETKVWIDSSSGLPLYTSNQDEFEAVSNMIGISDQYRFFELKRMKSIMENFLYFQSEDPTEQEIEEIKKTEQYAEMNAYPLENSIEWINGVLVVKLSQ